MGEACIIYPDCKGVVIAFLASWSSVHLHYFTNFHFLVQAAERDFLCLVLGFGALLVNTQSMVPAFKHLNMKDIIIVHMVTVQQLYKRKVANMLLKSKFWLPAEFRTWEDSSSLFKTQKIWPSMSTGQPLLPPPPEHTKMFNTHLPCRLSHLYFSSPRHDPHTFPSSSVASLNVKHSYPHCSNFNFRERSREQWFTS